MQPGSPRSRAYEAPTPGSRWANSPSGGSDSEAGTPRDNRDRDTTPASYGMLKLFFSLIMLIVS